MRRAAHLSVAKNSVLGGADAGALHGVAIGEILAVTRSRAAAAARRPRRGRRPTWPVSRWSTSWRRGHIGRAVEFVARYNKHNLRPFFALSAPASLLGGLQCH